VPTHTFASCPPLDLICIPGGSEGVAGVINDHEAIEFVRQQAGAAKYVTSVCTGAFVLGVAGLLRGDGLRRTGPTLIYCPSSAPHTKSPES
jgi:cyclohexyl-isocyanide hydratase